MPVRYKCKRCGYVLYEVESTRGLRGTGVLTPLQVIERYGYICPNCKRTLQLPKREDIIVKKRER